MNRVLIVLRFERIWKNLYSNQQSFYRQYLPESLLYKLKGVLDFFSVEAVPVVDDSPTFSCPISDKAAVADSNQINPCIDENKFKPITSRTLKTISRGVLNGLVVCGELPEYPQSAVEKNASGKVVLGVAADETGKVTNVSVISGKPSLNSVAVKAASQTRFCQTLLGGESMKIYGVLIYKFDREDGVSLPKKSPVSNSAD